MKYLRRGAAFVGAVLAVLLTGGVVVYMLMTGPRDLGAYPDPAQSPYLLPWRGGVTRYCIQGNRAVVSHRDWEEFAYDFVMPVGSDVVAARAGEVIKVVVNNDGHGYKWPNNYIAIRHEDGTLGYYLHIKKDGNVVHEGDHVKQGQILCASGHVGNSAMPHLHFHVTDAERKTTLPVTFHDVASDRGIPRMFHFYTSSNTVTAELPQPDH